MAIQHPPLPLAEPWRGLPADGGQGERIGALHREVEALRTKGSALEDDWECVQDFLKRLDAADRQRIGEMFAEAIRDCRWGIEDRLMEIGDMEEGAGPA